MSFLKIAVRFVDADQYRLDSYISRFEMSNKSFFHWPIFHRLKFFYHEFVSVLPLLMIYELMVFDKYFILW